MRRCLFPLCATAFCTALVIAPTVFMWPPRLIWNASTSVPIGLYVAWPVDKVEVGDLVTVRPPDDLAAFLADRGYLPLGLPLIKHVVALPGTKVCRKDRAIIVASNVLGETRERDRLERQLPTWQGCRVLAEGEVFLMNADEPDSLDGRYFGPLPVSVVTAQLTSLWTDGNGRSWSLHWDRPPDRRRSE